MNIPGKISRIDFMDGLRVVKGPECDNQVWREMGLREGIRREKPGIEGHFKDTMETSHSANFLKYMKTILMKSLNNEEDGVPTGHLLVPKEVSSIGNGLHPIELLIRGVPWKFSNSHRIH